MKLIEHAAVVLHESVNGDTYLEIADDSGTWLVPVSPGTLTRLLAQWTKIHPETKPVVEVKPVLVHGDAGRRAMHRKVPGGVACTFEACSRRFATHASLGGHLSWHKNGPTGGAAKAQAKAAKKRTVKPISVRKQPVKVS